MNTAAIEQLTAFSTPNRLPDPGNELREQRNWAIRIADSSIELDLEKLTERMNAAATRAVAQARDDRGLPVATELEEPVVTCLLVDAFHLILKVATVRLEDDKAYSYLVGASAAVQALHEVATVDDIQGIPRRFWRLLLGPDPGSVMGDPAEDPRDE